MLLSWDRVKKRTREQLNRITVGIIVRGDASLRGKKRTKEHGNGSL